MVEGDRIEIPDSHRHSEDRRSSQDTLGHKFERWILDRILQLVKITKRKFRAELKTELNHMKSDIPNIKVVSAKSRNNIQENSSKFLLVPPNFTFFWF